MSFDVDIRGVVETATVVISDTTTTTLLDGDDRDILVESVLYASVAGDTLTLDTYDGSTADRLAQVAIAANGNGAFTSSFVLNRGDILRGTLTTGNDAVIRVNYVILAT